MQKPCKSSVALLCQPLREAVSWNDTVIPVTYLSTSQPLREAVSWNIHLLRSTVLHNRQPLREAVSWNITLAGIVISVILSASSWGCELKWFCYTKCYFLQRQPLREAVSWNAIYAIILSAPIVSLFVRLWVEISYGKSGTEPLWSASSWGCELKYLHRKALQVNHRQPLREAVSWNK